MEKPHQNGYVQTATPADEVNQRVGFEVTQESDIQEKRVQNLQYRKQRRQNQEQIQNDEKFVSILKPQFYIFVQKRSKKFLEPRQIIQHSYNL